MPLRTTPTFTDQLLGALTDLENLFDIPRSMRQVVYSLEYKHYKLKRRRTETEQRERRQVQQALRRLEKAEYVSIDKRKNGDKSYRLTPKGWLKFAIKYAPILKKQEKREKQEDIAKGSYVIIFDIPEQHRQFRDSLRKVLLNIDCQPLQKSIFLTRRAETTRFIARIIANCELEDRVKILLVKQIL